MATKSLNYKIGADLGDLRRKMEEQGQLTAKARRELAALEAQQRKNRAAMDSLGKGMLTFGAAAVLGLGMAVREAVRWESAFAGVRKTVDGSDQEIAALEGELRELAKTLPATHQEIAAVAEAAGQLGIKRQDVAEFTRTMIDLGETTNLSAEEAATALAKFMNIMGTSASDVDRLGSALVALGNDGASTEADIIEMGLRIAGAGRQIGMSESQVLAFASALSSVGIEAEAGGSSFSRVMVDIAQAVNDGGDKLKAFADVAGMSTATFSQYFREDAAGAISRFVAGLGQMQTSGKDVFGVLEDLGLTEIRVRDALLRAAGASELFTDSLRTGSDAWIENEALAAEAAKRYQTSEAQMAMAGNAIKDALIDIGQALLPIVQGAIEGIRNLVTWFQNLPAPIQTAIAILGAATAAITVLGGVALIAVPKILAFRESMRAMVATGGGLGGALGKFGLFMSGPWGAAIGLGITLLGAFGMASGAAQQRQQELADAGKSVAQAIIEQNGAINQSVRIATAKAAAEKGILGNAKRLGFDLKTVTDAILDQGNAYDGLKSKIEGIVKAKQAELKNAQGGEYGGDTAKMEALQAEIDAYQGLLDGINGMRGGKEAELATEQQVAEATGQTTGELREQTDATQASADAAEEAAQAFEDLLTQLDRLNGVTLTAREAQRSYLDSITAVGESIKENGTSLDINTAAGRANLEALDAQASAANDLAEAVGREAEAQGGAAAGAAAMSASLEASRQALFNSARQFGLTETQAWAYVDSVLAIPEAAPTLVTTPGSTEAIAELKRVLEAVNGIPPDKPINVGVISAAAIQALKDIGFKVITLPDGSVTVIAQTQAARDALAGVVNDYKNRTFTWQVKINTTEVGRQGLGGRYTPAYGGILKFGSGGIFGESHHPQIAHATPGAVRVWAEPETGNESYIPWARDRRGRATDILGITADAFGYMLVPKSRMVRSYAYGGVTGGGGGSMADSLAGLCVQVFVGDREITDIVDVRVAEQNRRTKRAVTSGTGNAR